MFAVEEFIKYCSQTLESNFGQLSNKIIYKIRTKKNLDENSTDSDVNKFIDLIETNISVFSGKQKANEICNIIRAKVSEFESIPKEVTILEDTAKIFEKVEEVTKTDEVGEVTPKTDEIEEVTPKTDEEVTPKTDIEVASDIENITKTVEEIEEIMKTSDAEYIENKILVLLEAGQIIVNILIKLNIEEEVLADKIIDLDEKELIILEDKNWILTQKGKDLLKEKRELLKKLKLDYLHGNINKEEFLRKSKELEFLKSIEKEPKYQEENGEKKACEKCGFENKKTNRFCANCGEPLDTGSEED